MEISLTDIVSTVHGLLDEAAKDTSSLDCLALAVALERLRRGRFAASEPAEPVPDVDSLIKRADSALRKRLAGTQAASAKFSTSINTLCSEIEASSGRDEGQRELLERADEALSWGAALWRHGLLTESELDAASARLNEAVSSCVSQSDELTEFAARVDAVLTSLPERPRDFGFWRNLADVAPSSIEMRGAIASVFRSERRRARITEDFLASVARAEERKRAARGWPPFIARVRKTVHEIVDAIRVDLDPLPSAAQGATIAEPGGRKRQVVAELRDIAVFITAGGEGPRLHIEAAHALESLNVRCDDVEAEGCQVGNCAWEGRAEAGAWLVEYNNSAIAFRLDVASSSI